MHHPWSQHWPNLVAGAFATIGAVVFLMIVGILVTPQQSDAARLTVQTLSTADTGTVASTVSMRTDSVLEALSRLSSRQNAPTIYATRGETVTLIETLGRVNGDGGTWLIAINGDPVTDLITARLQRGDELRVLWIPKS